MEAGPSTAHHFGSPRPAKGSARLVFSEAPFRVYDRSGAGGPVITTTEAPHYRRVALQRLKYEGRSGEEIRRQPIWRGLGIRDGNGIMFVSHTGEICPSGFLPLPAGNVRKQSPVEVYWDAPLFRALRQPDGFGGKCGRCEFRTICGGSRARAYASSGSPFGEDPLCSYEPGGRVVSQSESM